MLRGLGTRLRIVSVNDVYALDNLARVETLLRRLEATPADRTLLFVAGDFVSPSLLAGIDHGRGAVAALNELGATHACLGNHEADISPAQLRRRAREFAGVWVNSNVALADDEGFRPFDVVAVGDRLVGVLGLLLDDPRAFSDGTFKGQAVAPVLESARALAWRMRSEASGGVDAVVALTHQGMRADEELGRDPELALSAVFGGHDHHVAHTLVRGGECVVVKAGCDASHAAVVDLVFSAGARLPAIESQIVDVRPLPPSPAMADVIERITEPVRALHEDVLVALGPQGGAAFGGGGLSSERSRLQQTTLGCLVVSAVRDELGADAAVINGATVKGNAAYPQGALTFADLRQELPFPTKMVVVTLPGHVLDAAVAHSRAGDPEREKRSYLQLDNSTSVTPDGRLATVAGQPFEKSREYRVALPRNLLAGFTDIRPLVEWAKANPGRLPDKSAFIPALTLVVRHYGRSLWASFSSSFSSLDHDGDGELSAEDVRRALEEAKGAAPSAALVASMVAALDENGDGRIQREEFDAVRPVRES